MKKTKITLYGWHYRPKDGKLSRGDTRPVNIGQTLQAKDGKGRLVKDAVLCGPGFHAIPKPSAHFKRSFGERLAFVMVEGCHPSMKARHKRGEKFVGTHRTVLWERVCGLGYEPDSSFNRASMTAKGRRIRAKRGPL